MHIYAEWIKNGHFDNGFFPSWGAYYDFTFDPEIEVKVVRVLAGKRRRLR